MVVKNAVIESVSINTGGRGLLTAYLHLDYGGSSHQGFGGIVLYLPKSFTHHELMSHAGHFIFRCMEIGDVESWENLKGKTIRVKKESEFGNIIEIGHIVKDDWFNPSKDFKIKE